MKNNIKIVIAPDSFKGSVSARDAADAIEQGLRDSLPELVSLEVLQVPIADGGEGTLDALVPAADQIEVAVTGTGGNTVQAKYGHIGSTAVIEMASAAGLTLVEP